MAIWIDDTLPQQDRWLDMSPAARCCLVELWAYCKLARNDGFIKNNRLSKAADSFTAVVEKELHDQGWLHRNATGCGTETCPKGIDGYSVVHDYLQHQESASDMSSRIDASREKSRKGNHKRWHEDRGVTDPDCPFCEVGTK